jgi:uncharacterized membrane protein YqaE (UPF0057 family)
MRKLSLQVGAMLFAAALIFNPVYAVVVVPKANPVADSLSVPDSATVKNALAYFKGMSRKEKKERFKEVKQSLKAYKAAKRSGGDTSTNTLLLVILAILLPPLAVYLHEGEINTRFWIDLILSLLFYIPGMIYALIIVLGDN